MNCPAISGTTMRGHKMVATAIIAILVNLGGFDTRAADTTALIVSGCSGTDAGILLGTEDLGAALKGVGQQVTTTWCDANRELPPGNVVLLNPSCDSKGGKTADSFDIRPLPEAGRGAIVIEGARRGVMYGALQLAERIRLGDDPWKVKFRATPAFPLRMFSEEGQLLDIPDRAYYTDAAPYVDEGRMRTEVDQLKQLLRHIAAHGFNAFCLLHLNVEEYIDYRYLDKEAYAKDDRHRIRSPVFCKYLAELCNAAHALHMDFYLQVYEFVCPSRLAGLYTLQLDHPDMAKVINARYKELFERVPLDGVVVTAAEQAARCGYVPKLLWQGYNPGAAAKMAVLYDRACKNAGGKCIFRLWRVAFDAKLASQVFHDAGPDVTFETKQTGGDFFIDWPLTTIVSEGLTKKQPTVVTFDTFRQYDGWSRLFCYMKQWGPRARACRDQGVVGINAWGPWSPACNVRDIDGVTWSGHWNGFRTFLRGFMPGQAHVYLISRLAWTPDADVKQIARDFCARHIGAGNAEAGAEALLATEDAFGEEYVKKAHPVYLRLAMLYQQRESFVNDAFGANSLAEILASNARALSAIDRMEASFAKTDPTRAADADRYARFKEGIEKTALYLRTFYKFREGLWRLHAAKTLTGQQHEANAVAVGEVRSQLNRLFDQWQRWPEEAGFWRITYRHGRPPEAAVRYFEVWDSEQGRTMESDAQGF